MTSLKKALLDRRVTVGSWLQICQPLIPEILAPAGFEWLVVDMEHSSMGLNDAMGMIMSIEANGMVPIVRVGENDPNLIKRVMDIGACGVIVANIKNRQEAQRAVDAVKYPPHGTRGVGLYRAQKFGHGFDRYKRWLVEESVVIAQIEHIDAVDHINEILTTPGIDAFIIGPYDMSASMGKPGEFDNPEFIGALKSIRKAAEQNGVPAGYHSVSTRAVEAKKRIEEGYTFLAFGVDFLFLSDLACNELAKLKEEIK
jgi:2-dehydro-3-deoxyglucarate aldolase